MGWKDDSAFKSMYYLGFSRVTELIERIYIYKISSNSFYRLTVNRTAYIWLAVNRKSKNPEVAQSTRLDVSAPFNVHCNSVEVSSNDSEGKDLLAK